MLRSGQMGADAYEKYLDSRTNMDEQPPCRNCGEWYETCECGHYEPMTEDDLLSDEHPEDI